MYYFKIILLILTLWTIPWKIYAIWLSVKNEHKVWFIVLIFLNTFSILEIFYIFKVENKKWIEVKEEFKKIFLKNGGVA